MVVGRVPAALFIAKGADTIMSRQRSATDLISFVIEVVLVIVPVKAIVAKPPPVPITVGRRPSFATVVTKETTMIVVSVPGVFPTYITMRANP